MSLTNAQARFAVENETGTVFCYLTNRHYEADGEQDLPDGLWDLAKVKQLILAGKPITAALLDPAFDEDEDKVNDANADFNAEIEAKQKAEAEQRAKEEAEAKAKAEAEEKAKAEAGQAP